jgi:hypothetical protein
MVCRDQSSAPALGSANRWDANRDSEVAKMTSDDGRLERLHGLVDTEPDGSGHGTTSALHRLCRVAVRVTDSSAAAVSLMSESGPSGIIASSGDRASAIAELQFSLGEGPSWNAFDLNRPVHAPDLESMSEGGWMAWSPAAGAHVVRAAFAFPLRVGPTQVGVLDIYRSVKGELSPGQLADIEALVAIATGTLLDGQEEAGEGGTPSGIDTALESGFAIYQAQGMVMVQLGVPLADAMSRLRAYAYANDRSLGEVARDIVARALTLERDGR